MGPRWRRARVRPPAAERVVGKFEEYDVPGRIVEGPWDGPLSQLAGHPVKVARANGSSYLAEPVTLVSEASIGRLAQEAGEDVDGRRFRMLLTLAGCSEHEEDTWRGSLLRIGEVVLRVGGPVPRCAATTRDPDTGLRDLDALRLIKEYRGIQARRHVDFGVYAQVEQPGSVELGDTVERL